MIAAVVTVPLWLPVTVFCVVLTAVWVTLWSWAISRWVRPWIDARIERSYQKRLAEIERSR